MKYIIYLFAFVLGGCSATKQTSEPTRHYLLVTLAENVNEDTLEKTYKEDGIESIRRNNRTLNIYACQVVKNQKALEKLLEKMSNDSNIVTVEIAETKTSPPTNSTNSKKAKAKPGKN